MDRIPLPRSTRSQFSSGESQLCSALHCGNSVGRHLLVLDAIGAFSTGSVNHAPVAVFLHGFLHNCSSSQALTPARAPTALSKCRMYVLPVSIVFISVATIVVALRLFTRIRLLNSPGWDDWFLLLALVCVPLTFEGFVVGWLD
jgi:hypothetical protein